MEISVPVVVPATWRAVDQEAERRFGQFGGIERRGGSAASDLPGEIEIREARDGTKGLTVKGYATVFDRYSLDLALPTGETFRERIATGAFDLALAKPTTRYLLLNHDRSAILGSSDAYDPESLELRVDPNGLRFFSRVVDTSYARDLKALMEAGIVRQASFGFTVAKDAWVERNGQILRTITEVDELFEVSITAQGAYPQTVASLVAKRAMDFAHEPGRLEGDEEHEVSPQGDGPGASDLGSSEESPSTEEAVPSEAEAVGAALSGGSRSQDERTQRIAELRSRLEAHKTDFQKGKKP